MILALAALKSKQRSWALSQMSVSIYILCAYLWTASRVYCPRLCIFPYFFSVYMGETPHEQPLTNTPYFL
jgi:hypothetical protein